MENIKKKVEDTIIELGRDANVEMEVSWKDSSNQNNSDISNDEIMLAILMKKSSLDDDSEDINSESQRSSPCVYFHSTKLFKVSELSKLTPFPSSNSNRLKCKGMLQHYNADVDNNSNLGHGFLKPRKVKNLTRSSSLDKSHFRGTIHFHLQFPHL